MADRYDDPNEYNWLMQEIMRHESWQALALGKLLYSYLTPKKVVDFGCGPGVYLLYFKACGCDVIGLDGASQAGAYIPGDFIQTDLRKRAVLYSQADLALCIEVAEHLKPEYADTLVESIWCNAECVFFSAARSGQGGEGHYNEQPKEYWIKKFEDRGWEMHPFNDKIMDEINNDDAYEHCHWLRWNSFLMRRKNG